MRRTTSLFILAFVAAGPAAAQGIGWLFGEPPPSYRRARPAPHPAPADVPLPPPRPHFPGDDLAASNPPPVAASAKTPEPDRSSAARPTETKAAEAKPPVAPIVPTPTVPAPATPAPAQAAAPAAPTPPTPPLPPEKPPSLGGSPTASPPPTTPPPTSPPAPAVAPSGATTAFDPRQPVADPDCAAHLAARGVTAEPTDIGPQPDARCTVVQPMKLVSEVLADGSAVTFPDKPVIACVTADAFSAYVHDLVAPLAKGTWGVGLASVWTGPGLECRSRDHVFGAKLSAHGQGLAVDIAQLKLGDGRVVAVGEPKTDVERGFETAARAGGCGYFHTVLGPGSDSYHRTHWHFDLEVRGKEGDSKYCK